MDQMGAPVGLSQNLDSIPAGTYTFQVIDQNECTITIENIQVDEPLFVFEVALEVEHLACFGTNAGAITAFPTGGSPLYAYTWNVPGTNPFLENLAAGTYFLTVEDSKGCLIFLDSIEVLQPDAPLALDSVLVSPILCSGVKNGAIDISISGGTIAYDFIWSNGKVTEDITGLGPGNFKCTIVDANGCQLITPQFMLANPQVLQVVGIAIDTATIGLEDGAIGVAIEGGTMPYTYLWSSGDTTALADSLFAGNYELTVTDANGCVLELQIYLPFHVIDGIQEVVAGNLRIYPNPASGSAWLEFPPGDFYSLDLVIRNVWGQSIRAQHLTPLPERIVPIDLTGLPGGVYHVQIRSEGLILGEALLIVTQ
ncbi:MAG: hypothetical protein IPJ40_06950 [Saprospirales bacterium]|nr:hypothetical protein [Saprospirales bacterium]